MNTAAQAQFDFSSARASATGNADVMAKLRKLMNTNGRTEAERDSAEILAAAIAAKHGIDLQQIDLAESRPSMEIKERIVGQWFSVPKEASFAAAVCVKYFEVSQITLIGYEGAKEVFIGVEYHLDIAEQVFKFLMHEFRYRWNRCRGRVRNRNAFMHGMFVALIVKLKERFAARPGQAGLEVSWKSKRESYMQDHYPDTTSKDLAPRKKSCAAQSRGYAAWKDIEIRPAVKDAKHGPQPGRLGQPNERKLLSNSTALNAQPSR